MLYIRWYKFLRLLGYHANSKNQRKVTKVFPKSYHPNRYGIIEKNGPFFSRNNSENKRVDYYNHLSCKSYL